MIATTSSASHINRIDQSAEAPGPRWQRLAAESITDPEELLRLLGLDRSLIPMAKRAAETFPLRVPRAFVGRMQKGNPKDPLLMQVLPIGLELDQSEGFVSDPVGDLKSRKANGVLHKYNGRALLISTGACAIHCRYCFRRHFPYSEETASTDRWRDALGYIRDNTSLNEIILSGGDPLNLSDRRLQELSSALEDIPHIKRLRIHTRTAVVLPERIDSSFINWLANVKLQKVMVLHTNHAREIDDSVAFACKQIRESNAMLLNQSVLLSGINDSVEVLTELSESLFAIGVMPYYLSLLDRVAGAAHFEVDAERGAFLMRQLSATLPGYLVPRLVQEIAGANSKTSVSLFV